MNLLSSAMNLLGCAMNLLGPGYLLHMSNLMTADFR